MPLLKAEEEEETRISRSISHKERLVCEEINVSSGGGSDCSSNSSLRGILLLLDVDAGKQPEFYASSPYNLLWPGQVNIISRPNDDVVPSRDRAN